MLENYQTLVSEEHYQSLGLVSTIVGLFLLAYLFMYSWINVVIKTLTKLNKDLSTCK